MITNDIGSGIFDSIASDPWGGQHTFLDLSNPAETAETLTELDIKPPTAMTGVKVGAFYLVGGTTYHCRSIADISNLDAGVSYHLPISLAVQPGDVIGIFCATGNVVVTYSGGSGFYYAWGDKVTVDSESSFALWGNYPMSLYAHAGTHPVYTSPSSGLDAMAQEWGINLAGLALAGMAGGEPAKREHGVYGLYDGYYYRNSVQEMNYFRHRGMGNARVAFEWFRLQHSLGADLDPNDLSYLDAVVDDCTTRGFKVCIEPHDYARFYSVSDNAIHVLGDGVLTATHLTDLWTKLAGHFRGRVWAYDLMNEPHDLAGGVDTWMAAVQEMIYAIRAVDLNTPIIVPGYGWQSCSGWVANGNDAMRWLDDPSRRLIFSGHQYYDANQSGGYATGDTCSGCGDMMQRAAVLLSPFMDWCRANSIVGLIGETGLPGTDYWLGCLGGLADYAMANADVLCAIQMWTSWPWPWLGYSMLLAPDGQYCDGTEKPQMILLSEYMSPISPAAPSASTNPATNVTGATAVLNGEVTSFGSAFTVTAFFEWGANTAYGRTSGAINLLEPGPVSIDVAGLQPEETYHFRLVVEGSDGMLTYGEDVTLITGAALLRQMTVVVSLSTRAA
jgi:endoglucanase